MNGGAWVTSTANKDMMFYGSPATIAGKTKDADRWLPRVNGAGRSRARARGPRRGRRGGGDEAKHERRAHRVFSCGCFVCVCIAGANGLDRRRGWNRARVRRTWRAAWYLVIII